MNTIIDIIMNNSLISTLVGSAIIGLIIWLFKLYRRYKDSKVITQFLAQSTQNTQYVFRSTEAIASKTNLSEERVAFLCSTHPKIIRNSKEKQSWKFIN